MRTGPCDWPISELACADLSALDYGVADLVEQMAVDLLWNWTGRIFGVCEQTVRPCHDHDEDEDVQWSGYGALLIIPPYGCDRKCSNSCDCRCVPEIRLPGPVVAVSEVVIDGDVLDPDNYRVDNFSRLVRTDGETWPKCQDLALDATETNTWQITYTSGIAVPSGGQLAAATLACEIAKAVTGSDCDLPQRLTSITREGVSMAVLDTFEGLEAGRSGIWLVDSWVTSINNVRKRAQVLSPDVGVPYRRST